MKYNGQALQDKFVCEILKSKKNGFFLEIGSNDPIIINNTYVLEKELNWKGIMVEYKDKYLKDYKIHRQNSIHVIDDATNVNYLELFLQNDVPKNIDYLQIDLEALNGSSLHVLEKLNNDVLDKYKFATITFEHDIYHTNNYHIRKKSREILKQRGYIFVFQDVGGSNRPFEDWYVHPALVDMEHVNYIIDKNKEKYKNNVRVFDKSLVTEVINFNEIEY
tara:strand:- start:111 stop:770 length:660 start_codon:yes stop_codon:yes gene_type:complete